MASAFDPSAFIAAENSGRSQPLAAVNSVWAWGDPEPEPAENRRSSRPVEPTLATLATIAGDTPEKLPWADDLERFGDTACPSGVRPDYWDELTQEAWTVSRDWGQQALDLGWSSLDLFGCNPVPFPFARRIDRDGLVMASVGLLTAVRIVSLSADGAELRDQHSTMRFYRRLTAGAVHLWEAFAMHGGP